MNIMIDGQKVEQINKFKYLGAWIAENGRCETEIRTRIGMAKDAFSKRKDLLSGGLSRVVKNRIIKAMVWSMALYGAWPMYVWCRDMDTKKGRYKEN